MVYNFALPPLVLHTFYREDTTALSNWARDLEYPSKTTTFLNMLDTHDGVGLMGVKNILPKKKCSRFCGDHPSVYPVTHSTSISHSQFIEREMRHAVCAFSSTRFARSRSASGTVTTGFTTIFSNR